VTAARLHRAPQGRHLMSFDSIGGRSVCTASCRCKLMPQQPDGLRVRRRVARRLLHGLAEQEVIVSPAMAMGIFCSAIAPRLR
jgi:hypothetical protein